MPVVAVCQMNWRRFVDLLHDSDERMAVLFVQPLVSLKSPEVNRTEKLLSQNLIFSVVNRT